MEIREAKITQNFADGIFSGKGVSTGVKRYSEAKGFYLLPDERIPDDTVMYEVYSYTGANPSGKAGGLNWGLTVMKPVLVNGECNITRGHFHQALNCDEIYFCFQGEGLLLYMDENGKCWAEKMSAGSVHYIDGRLAHRLVNTGDGELHIGACWPTDAGHDYERVQEHPFGVRVFKTDGLLQFRETV